MTPLDLSDIHGAIRASHLVVPFERVMTLSPASSADAAAEAMLERGFDLAPVTQQGTVIGVFSARHRPKRAKTVRGGMQSRQLAIVVTADTTYRQLLTELQQQSLLLVLEKWSLLGIVTPGDMGSAPGRTHFYLLLSGLEMALAELVRRLFPDQADAVALLSQSRRAKAESLLQLLRAQDDQLDSVAAVSLHDLVTIVRKTPAAREVAEAQGFRLKKLGSLDDFRNDVMHPVREFTHATADGLARLQRWDDDLTHLLKRVQEALGASAALDAPSGPAGQQEEHLVRRDVGRVQLKPRAASGQTPVRLTS